MCPLITNKMSSRMSEMTLKSFLTFGKDLCQLSYKWNHRVIIKYLRLTHTITCIGIYTITTSYYMLHNIYIIVS